MSLQLAARHLAAHGRGPDSTLVHMAPNEVNALQGLARAAGGSLTTNPHTGLPEAGFLSSLLPMLAGAGLTIASGGTASPWLAPLLVGGVTGAASGNLMKGITAGLGAYGGAGIGNALTSMGTEAATSLSPEATKELTAHYAAGNGNAATALLAGQPSTATSLANAAASPYNTMWEGAKAAVGNPSGFVDALGPNAARYGMAAAAPLLSDIMQPPTPKGMAIDSNPGPVPKFSYGAANPFPTPSSTGVEQRYSNPRYNYAAGGIADGYSTHESNLGSYSDGGRLLRGPGDGVSDSIPATIGGHQPARLADGEFVVPARIVSELGNGSTEAGAKQLYAMMDRIQHARRKTTGAKQVAAKTNAQKLMPV